MPVARAITKVSNLKSRANRCFAFCLAVVTRPLVPVVRVRKELWLTCGMSSENEQVPAGAR